MSTNHPTGLLLVGYARCSSAMQERSVPQQLEWIDTESQRQGHSLVEVFTDDAIPGHDLAGREGFQRMLDWCERRRAAGDPVNGVIMFLLSRFSRADAFATGEAWNRMRHAGVRWVITSQRTYDLSSRADRTLLMIEQESEAAFSPTLATNVTRALASRAQTRPVAPPPYGYRTKYRPTGRQGKSEPECWVLDPDETPVVKRIFRLYTSGKHSLRSIADQLNREGILTPSASGPAPRKNASKDWSGTAVRRVLTNEVYLGVHVWNRRRCGVFACTVDGVPQERPEGEKGRPMKNDPDQVIRRENAHPAIVDAETFDRAAELLERNRESPAPARKKTVYLFSGLLRCGDCGRVMMGRSQRNKPPSYWCSTYSQSGRGTCPPNRVNESRFLAAVAAKLQERFGPEQMAEFERELRASLTSETAGDDDVRALEARLADLETEVRDHARRILRVAEELLPDLEGEVLAVKRRRDAVSAELAKARRRRQETPDEAEALVGRVMAAVQDLWRVLREGDRGDVRAFFRDHVKQIRVYFNPPDGTLTERYARAVIYLRPDSPLVPSVTETKSYAAG